MTICRQFIFLTWFHLQHFNVTVSGHARPRLWTIINVQLGFQSACTSECLRQNNFNYPTLVQPMAEKPGQSNHLVLTKVSQNFYKNMNSPGLPSLPALPQLMAAIKTWRRGFVWTTFTRSQTHSGQSSGRSEVKLRFVLKCHVCDAARCWCSIEVAVSEPHNLGPLAAITQLLCYLSPWLYAEPIYKRQAYRLYIYCIYIYIYI